MNRRLSAKELAIVCYERDYYKGLPQLVHVVRKGQLWVSKPACGKDKDRVIHAYPFNRWIFDNSPLLCRRCHDIVLNGLMESDESS